MVIKGFLIGLYGGFSVFWMTVMQYQIMDADMELKQWLNNMTRWNIICCFFFLPATILNIILFYIGSGIAGLNEKIEKHEGFLFKKIGK